MKLYTTKTERKFMPGFGWVEHVKCQVKVLGKTREFVIANHPISVHSISEEDVQNAALAQLFFQNRLQS